MSLTVFKIILLLFIFAYVSQIIVLLIGTRKLTRFRDKTAQPVVSVIIAARNESENIRPCLKSLAGLDYPHDRLEIIIVDDRSEDNTAGIARTFMEQMPYLSVYSVSEIPANLTGKANAMAYGIQQSHGEILMFTDADCLVPPEWIREYMACFSEQVGLVTGITVLDHPHAAKSLFGKIQSLDWVYLLGIGVSAARIGIPLSCVGNNFALRKTVYNEIGGFSQLGFSVTEDFALLKKILSTTQWKVHFSFNKDLLVVSKPALTLKDLFHQRKRWATGSRFVRFFGKLLILIGGVTHILLPITPFYPSLMGLGLAGFLSILSADFIFLWRVTSLIRRQHLMKYFLLFEIYYFLYTTIYAVVLLFSRQIRWKGVLYDLKNQRAAR